jgi:hypothetical protein
MGPVIKVSTRFRGMWRVTLAKIASSKPARVSVRRTCAAHIAALLVGDPVVQHEAARAARAYSCSAMSQMLERLMYSEAPICRQCGAMGVLNDARGINHCRACTRRGLRAAAAAPRTPRRR